MVRTQNAIVDRSRLSDMLCQTRWSYFLVLFWSMFIAGGCRNSTDRLNPLYEGDTYEVLVDLVRNCDIGEVKREFSRNIPLNADTPYGSKTLRLAISYNRPDIVAFLLDNGVDSTGTTPDEEPLLRQAWSTAQFDTVKLLARHGAAVDAQTATICGLEKELGEMIDKDRSLLSRRFSVRRKIGHNRYQHLRVNLIDLAAMAGSVDSIALLVKRGADPNSPAPYGGRTAIHRAASWGQAGSVVALAKFGARMEPDALGWSPLLIASVRGHTEAVDALRGLEAPIDVFVAASLGDLESVKTLSSSSKGGVDAALKCGTSLLDIAVMSEQLEVTRWLLSKGARIRNDDNDGANTLNEAIRRGNLDLVKLLCRSGARINGAKVKRGDSGNPPLVEAMANSQTAIARCLILEGADVNAANGYGASALQYAVMGDHEELTRLLVSKGASVNHRGSMGVPIWFCAINTGNVRLLKLLMDANAYQGAKVGDDLTAFGYAIHSQNPRVVRYFLDRGVDLSARHNQRNNLFHLLSRRNPRKLKESFAIAQMLIDAGYGVNTRDAYGLSILHLIGSRDLPLMKWLVDHGGNVNIANNAGETPLHGILYDEKTLRFFIERGADVNAKNKKGKTPADVLAGLFPIGNREVLKKQVKILIRNGAKVDFNLACSLGDEKIVKQAIKKNPKVVNLGSNGVWPIECAVNSGSMDVLKMLLDSGAKVDPAPNALRWRAIHFAVYTQRLDMVKLLVKHGANVNSRDENGKRTLYWASHTRYNEMIEYLKSIGAE